MPDIGKSFPSKYLKASDLQDREVVVKMDRVEFEKVGNDQKPILYFAGKNKGLVLNKTNANKIVEITGSALTEDWRGHDIRLYPTETSFQGDTVECIRIKPVSRQAMKMTPVAPPPAPPEVISDEMGSDEIPF